MNALSLKSTRLVVALLAAGAIGGGSVTALQNLRSAHAAPAPMVPAANGASGTAMALLDFSQITARYGLAVVNVSVTGKSRASEDSPAANRGQREDPFGNDPFFEFFRRFQQGQGQAVPRDTPVHGQGSGFIVSADGIILTNAHQALADSFKLDKPEGALVSAVEKDGPADKAGLQPGDVIRRADGNAIVSSGDLPAALALSTPGDTMSLDVWRNGRALQIQAALAGPSTRTAQVATAQDPAPRGRLGLALRPLRPDESRQAGIDGGMLVENVTGPAALAGVEPGDVLIAINGTAARSAEQISAVMARAGKSVALPIQRGEEKIFVPVRPG